MSAPAPATDRAALVADLARYGLLVLCFFFLAAFVIAAVNRAVYPFELDWLEGSLVDHVARVVAGESLYVAPSISFVPHPHAPLYYWVSAGFAWVLGVGFLPLRLVSIGATFGCLLVLFRLVERETTSRHAGLAAAAIFAATYPLTAMRFDLARVDSLGLLATLGGVLLLRAATTPRTAAAAGVAFAAGFFTWPVALVVAVPLGLHAVATGRGAGRWVFAGTTLGLIGLGCAWAAWWSDGWFGFYVLSVPGRLMTVGPAPAGSPFGIESTGARAATLLQQTPLLVLLAVSLLWPLARARHAADAAFHAALAIGLGGAVLALGAASPADVGAEVVPASALLALLAGLAIHRVPQAAAAGSPGRGRLVATVVHTLCVVQLAALFYDPTADLPQAIDRAEGERRVELMRQTEGEIWSPIAGQLPRLAGKTPTAHFAAIANVVRVGGHVGQGLLSQIDEALDARRFAVVFAPRTGLPDALRDHYAPTRMGSPSQRVTYPRGPAIARSREIQLPRVR